SGAKKKLDYTYDYQGRRIQKIVSTWNGSAYVAASTNRFLYDGWNLIAELNNTNGVIRSYLWGLDLSGSEQGAGGVGGLLAIKPTGTNTLFVAYDGNGNVTGLIDATTGTTTGNFEYGPFGETIRLTPNANNQSPFRFSTKYTDDESDMVYYGYRSYNPNTGRWLSRDPVGENNGADRYLIVNNSTVNTIDYLGLLDANQQTVLYWLQVAKERVGSGQSDAVKTTDLDKLLDNLGSLVPNINVVVDANRVGNRGALYIFKTHTMYIGTVLSSPQTMVHEMIHARNDLVFHWPDTYGDLADRWDEGMAYFGERFLNVNQEFVWAMERRIKQVGELAAKSFLERNWPNLWSQYGNMPSTAWGTGAYDLTPLVGHFITEVLPVLILGVVLLS
ncbi:MAG TPA: RHS repeat-associated core domain-containing protein, partial [Candidatus Angelobacter sp.]|nr:RHS repeat-associated core domain-containing protein [Candidatus Angelobacter sp.]